MKDYDNCFVKLMQQLQIYEESMRKIKLKFTNQIDLISNEKKRIYSVVSTFKSTECSAVTDSVIRECDKLCKELEASYELSACQVQSKIDEITEEMNVIRRTQMIEQNK